MNVPTMMLLTSICLAWMSAPFPTDGFLSGIDAKVRSNKELDEIRVGLRTFEAALARSEPQLRMQQRLAAELELEVQALNQQINELSVLENLTAQRMTAKDGDFQKPQMTRHLADLRRRRIAYEDRLTITRDLLADATARVDDLLRRRSDHQQSVTRLRANLRLLELAAASRAANRDSPSSEAESLGDWLERHIDVRLNTWRLQRDSELTDEGQDDRFPLLTSEESFSSDAASPWRRDLLRLSLTAAWWMIGWSLMIAADRRTDGYRRWSVVIGFAMTLALGAAWIWS